MPIGTIYTAETGMLTFSKGLDTVSNNVANLNTAGFKRSDLLFRDLFYEYSRTAEGSNQSQDQQEGSGVTDAGTVTSFTQGEIQQTGNDTDAAINGNGFFILQDEDRLLFTRSGQFEFDSDGYLVNSSLDLRVAGLNNNNEIVDININEFRTIPAQPTTEVSFVGNLSTGSTDHEITDIEIIDSLGETGTFRAEFTNNNGTTPRSWLIDVFDEDDNEIASDLEIRFQADGSPEVDFNTVSFSYTSESGTTDTVAFNFGDPGSLTQTTYFSSGSTSSAAVDSQDGVVSGSLLEVDINETGLIEAVYSNDERAGIGNLGLAWFTELQNLRQIGNSIFLVTGDQQPIIGRGSETVFGEIVGGSIEISNVELTQEFSDLIIIQRGFQASSQILSTANEMIQELLTAGRGQ